MPATASKRNTLRVMNLNPSETDGGNESLTNKITDYEKVYRSAGRRGIVQPVWS